MRYKIVFFSFFIQTFFLAQKIRIVDSESLAPISNARIISNDKIYYTNDDGFALLPDTHHRLEVNANGYVPEEKPFDSIIKLNPKYNDIDEVKIVSIDFQKILKTVFDNYSNIYDDQPIIYDVTIKEKSYENNQLKLLAIADGKFWSKDGVYHPKEAINDKFDKFVQLQIDDLRYLKKEARHPKIKLKKQKISHDNIGDMFLSYELWRTHSLSKIRNAKVSGRLISETPDEQEIFYSIKSDSAYMYTGNFIYNKKDKAITHFELDFTQSNSKLISYKTDDGNYVKRQLGDGLFIFDYYKNGDKYYPARISVSSKNFKNIYDDETVDYKYSRDIIFKSFTKTDKNGLENPVRINEYYWDNLQLNPDKGEILLSKEEERFINESKDEK